MKLSVWDIIALVIYLLIMNGIVILRLLITIKCIKSNLDQIKSKALTENNSIPRKEVVVLIESVYGL